MTQYLMARTIFVAVRKRLRKQKMPDAQGARLEGAGRRVLIVDDDASTLRMLEEALKRRGYETVTALSPAEGLEKLNHQNFDLILADIIMPEMDGLQFLTEVRKRPDTATISFIFLTADRRSKVKSLEMGVDDYITKPCAIDELYARMAAVLRRNRAAAVSAAPTGSPRDGWDLSGKISFMSPLDLVQSLHISRKTGLLRLASNHVVAEVFFKNGEVVHATIGKDEESKISGPDAIELIMNQTEGVFDFRDGVEATVRTVMTGTQGLLMEMMRLRDQTERIIAEHKAASKRAERKPEN